MKLRSAVFSEGTSGKDRLKRARACGTIAISVIQTFDEAERVEDDDELQIEMTGRPIAKVDKRKRLAFMFV